MSFPHGQNYGSCTPLLCPNVTERCISSTNLQTSLLEGHVLSSSTLGFLLNPVLQDGDPVACSYKVEQFTALWGLYALGVFDGVIYSKISWEATSWRAVANCLSWHYTTYNTNLRQYSLFSLEGENLWNGTALSTLLEDFAWWNCLSGVRKVKMCCFEKLPAQLALTKTRCVCKFLHSSVVLLVRCIRVTMTTLMHLPTLRNLPIVT